MKEILVIPGDGIGKEVMKVAIDILNNILSPNVLSFIHDEAGFEYFNVSGSPVSPTLIENLMRCDGVLFGASGTPSPPPEGFYSPIVFIRKVIGAMINVRHCRNIKGDIDFLVLRELSEGLYSSKETKTAEGYDVCFSVTQSACIHLANLAVQFARHRKKQVSVVHKANVLTRSDGFFQKNIVDVLTAHGITAESVLSDAAGYHIVTDPRRFDVIVANNHDGDLLSDVAAGVCGGLGLIPSISFGGSKPLAEPIHGSAPDIAGKNRADPVATLLSACLLLDHLGFDYQSQCLRDAIYQHLAMRTGELLTTNEIAVDITRLLQEKIS
ncbi:isocitrate/isopropylmalate dehydrogenase family protein [Salmonella enterica subsp. enterica serovar Sandiego]|nr:isocitrate/isopropylmalate dehydrogenase family protein [Salmonella enterica subsp. enterica serovar Sandiego]